MTSNRRLVMEDSGFDPSSMFTEEQISKMRSMRPRGQIAEHKAFRGYIKISDRNIVNRKDV